MNPPSVPSRAAHIAPRWSTDVGAQLREGGALPSALTLAIVASLVSGLFVIGGVTDATLAPTAALVILATAISAARTTPALGRASQLAHSALWLATAVSALQLVPMPLGLLRLLSPRNAETWERMELLFATGRHFHPFSIDPPATTFGAMTSAVVAAYFDVCARYAMDAARRDRLLRIVGITVLVFGVVSVAQGAAGFTRIYGIYVPIEGPLDGGRVIAPIVNANHAAAVTGAGVAIMVGLGLGSERGAVRALWWIAALFSAVVTILTLSRGGMLVLLLTGVALVVALVRRRSRMRTRVAVIASVVAFEVLTGAVAWYAEREHVAREATNADFSKLAVVATAVRLLRDNLWLGIGRSAFGTRSALYDADVPGQHRFVFVENWPAQIACDYGVPIACFLAGLMAFALLRGARFALRRSLHATAVIAVVGLAAHDLFDFSTSFAGVGMLAAALLACVTSCDAPRRASEARNVASRDEDDADGPATVADRGRLLLAGVLAVALPFGMAFHDNRESDDEARILSAKWASGRLQHLERAIAGAAARHPAEPYFFMMEGVRRFGLGRSDAAPFLIEAFNLGPGRAATHFWLARLFVATDHSGQAWVEYREALKGSDALMSAIITDMLNAECPTDELLEVLRTSQQLNAAATALASRGRDDDAALLDAQNIERFPPAIDAQGREVGRALRREDEDTARRIARRQIHADPTRADGYVALASLLSTPAAGERVLEAGVRLAPDDINLLTELARVKGTRLGLEAVAHELSALSAAHGATDGRTFEVSTLRGSISEQRGRLGDAIRYYLEGAQLSPDGCANLEHVARLEEGQNQFSSASTSWQTICDVHPNDVRACANAERLRNKATAQRLSVPSEAPR